MEMVDIHSIFRLRCCLCLCLLRWQHQALQKDIDFGKYLLSEEILW